MMRPNGRIMCLQMFAPPRPSFPSDFARMPILSGTARAYTIPTDAPEADGTIAWDSTTLGIVQLQAGEAQGIGYTYSHKTAATVAQELIDQHCLGASPLDTNRLYAAMRISQRNYGREGIGAA